MQASQKTRDGERTLRQAERQLVDTNMLHALPERCAVLYGAGLAQFFFTSPIAVAKNSEATQPVSIPKAELESELSTKANLEFKTAPLTTAQSLLDVD